MATEEPAQAVRRLYTTRPAAKALFDDLGHRERHSAHVTTDTAVRLTGCDDAEALQLLRDMDAAGLGKLKMGRHGYKTRLEWFYSVLAIAQVAKGRSDQLARLDGSEDEVEIDDAEVSLVPHSFVLRPGLTITFKLPTDLSQREADRLAGLITHIPH